MSARPGAPPELGPIDVLSLTGLDVPSRNTHIQKRDDWTWHARFLREFLKTEGDLDAAAKKAGVSVYVVYAAEMRHPKLAAELLEARAIIDKLRADRIEKATAERAISGTPYTKYNGKGEVSEEGTTPDTPAAALMLKALKPERFRDKDKGGDGEIRSVTDMFRAVADAAKAAQAAGELRHISIRGGHPGHVVYGDKEADALDNEKLARGEPTGGEDGVWQRKNAVKKPVVVEAEVVAKPEPLIQRRQT